MMKLQHMLIINRIILCTGVDTNVVIIIAIFKIISIGVNGPVKYYYTNPHIIKIVIHTLRHFQINVSIAFHIDIQISRQV